MVPLVDIAIVERNTKVSQTEPNSESYSSSKIIKILNTNDAIAKSIPTTKRLADVLKTI